MDKWEQLKKEVEEAKKKPLDNELITDLFSKLDILIKTVEFERMRVEYYNDMVKHLSERLLVLDIISKAK